MFIASQEGHSSVVELLLKADGVDVNKGNKDGATPIFIAAAERSRVRGRVTGGKTSFNRISVFVMKQFTPFHTSDNSLFVSLS